MDNERKYWLVFAGLFVSFFIFSAADPCTSYDYDMGYCEYNAGLTFLSVISCFGSFVPMGLAINERRKKGFSNNIGGTRTVIVNTTPAQRVIRQTQQVRRPVRPMPPMPPQRVAPMTEKNLLSSISENWFISIVLTRWRLKGILKGLSQHTN